MGSSPISPTKVKGKFVKVYGPYLRKDGRQHVILQMEDGRKITRSYPKYLMEIHLGRELSKDETVDHIDGDKNNNDIENLRVLSREDNARLASFKLVIPEEMPCVWCGNTFKPVAKSIKPRKTGASGFCSRKCSGEYGAAVQAGSVEKIYTKYDLTYFSEQFGEKKVTR